MILNLDFFGRLKTFWQGIPLQKLKAFNDYFFKRVDFIPLPWSNLSRVTNWNGSNTLLSHLCAHCFTLLHIIINIIYILNILKNVTYYIVTRMKSYTITRDLHRGKPQTKTQIYVQLHHHKWSSTHFNCFCGIIHILLFIGAPLNANLS